MPNLLLKIFKPQTLIGINILFTLACILPVYANGKHDESIRPDNHAPIGVTGDHFHEAGKLMFSYRFIGMGMNGLRDGTEPISTENALKTYATVPTAMQMQMHMFGTMFAPHDVITLMAMTSYRSNFMEMKGAHDHATGGHDHAVGFYDMESVGLSDLRLSSLIPLLNRSNLDLVFKAGVSIPTGSIAVEGTQGGNEETVFPYPMQLGSGSFELMPGATVMTTQGNWSFGLQANAAIPLNENNRGYKLGTSIDTTVWGARKLNDWLSVSIRGSFANWGNVSGRDTAFDPKGEMKTTEDHHDTAGHDDHHHAPSMETTGIHYLAPTMDPNLRGGTRGNLSAGVNFIVPDKIGGILAGQRLAIELQMPVYQNLNGPQMELGWNIVVGWQYAFVLW